MAEDASTPDPGEGSGRAHDGEVTQAARAAAAAGITADEAKARESRSAEERAEDGDDGQTEMFPLGMFESDGSTTPRNLIARNSDVEYTVSMRSAEIPMRGGLPSPHERKRLVVTTEVSKVENVPVRNADSGKVESWKVRATLRPTYTDSLEKALEDPDFVYSLLADGGEARIAAAERAIAQAKIQLAARAEATA